VLPKIQKRKAATVVEVLLAFLLRNPPRPHRRGISDLAGREALRSGRRAQRAAEEGAPAGAEGPAQLLQDLDGRGETRTPSSRDSSGEGDSPLAYPCTTRRLVVGYLLGIAKV
jgi:hypothetical protein